MAEIKNVHIHYSNFAQIADKAKVAGLRTVGDLMQYCEIYDIANFKMLEQALDEIYEYYKDKEVIA